MNQGTNEDSNGDEMVNQVSTSGQMPVKTPKDQSERFQSDPAGYS